MNIFNSLAFLCVCKEICHVTTHCDIVTVQHNRYSVHSASVMCRRWCRSVAALNCSPSTSRWCIRTRTHLGGTRRLKQPCPQTSSTTVTSSSYLNTRAAITVSSECNVSQCVSCASMLILLQISMLMRSVRLLLCYCYVQLLCYSYVIVVIIALYL